MSRAAPVLRWTSLVVFGASLVALLYALPVSLFAERLRGWAEGAGSWASVVYGGVYVLGAVLFVPGWALTVGAGAVFGLVRGAALVSIASTVAAGLAFLLARYLIRNRVAELARQRPRFGAVDRAIGASGWKIVALLRLSPVFPYSIGNYLFGLTPIRFLPYLLASWLFMLPGVFLYTYFGVVGVNAARGGTGGVWEQVLLWGGLLLTLVATVYVTRLSKRRLEEQAGQAMVQEPVGKRRGGRAVALTLLALVTAAAASWANLNREQLRAALGPPVVAMREVYEQDPGAKSFDHGRFDRLLRDHVDARGLVDYTAVAREVADLDAYLEQLEEAPFAALSRDHKLALLLNAYNAFTLRLIAEHYPLGSIREIPESQRWQARRWRLAGEELSLDALENRWIRPRFVEPRIHFALVCAALGCPPLRAEAYDGARLQDQLEDQARRVHEGARWLRLDGGVVHLTQLYWWYRSDFAQVAGTPLEYAARYAPALRGRIEGGAAPEIRWLPYDWALNDRASGR